MNSRGAGMTARSRSGSRLTLAFNDHVPELTGAQVKALLAPLISFDVKTPIQAFTDTLPPKLKDAILNHHVLVGMSTDMVLFAKGQPQTKSREMDGQMPFEEWIYGKPPEEVDFVRINGNRVIRVEIAKMGEPPVIFTKDEVEGLMRTDGTPLEAATRTRALSQEGDVERDPDKQAPAAAAQPAQSRRERCPTDDRKQQRGSDEAGAVPQAEARRRSRAPIPTRRPPTPSRRRLRGQPSRSSELQPAACAGQTRSPPPTSGERAGRQSELNAGRL